MHSVWTIRYLSLFILLLLAGCGGGGGTTPAVSAAGKHPVNWYSAHRLAYIRDKAGCQECHGLPLDPAGGITRINCTTTCHRGGHGPRDIHEIPYVSPSLHGSDAKIDLIYCQYCHGQTGGAGSNPRFNVANMNPAYPNGCESANCHNGAALAINLGHPKPWLGHRTSGNQANACALCHGANYGGGTGPACSGCHKKLAVGAIPATQDNCKSCHDNPPSGILTNYPNYAGSHSKHTSLPIACSACHLGSGSGTSVHYEGSRNQSVPMPASVVFGADYNAKRGVAAVSGARGSRTCSYVRCHGGVAAIDAPSTPPVWGGPSIDSTVDCVKCHLQGTAYQTPEYNSYYSGKHVFHLSMGGPGFIPCTGCHDMTDKTRHFGNLATPGFETVPASTLKSYIVYSAGSCSVPRNPPGGFTCHISPNDPKYRW